MSRKFKSQASSARAASGFGGFGGFQTAASPLSYITEQPDLSQITESNVVVAFKNLSKKDSITKAKALDELIDSLKNNADLNILTAWADLYPRTSIDNSQAVRRNAHTLQGLLTQNAGKSIVPLLAKLVPSWLAGTFDNDKSVAKAASDALDKTFASAEKRNALWKVYKDAIYERVVDSLLTQTPTSLSDERLTSADEAEAKYVRVVGTGIRLFSQLITSDLENGQEILNDKKLWELLYHKDSSLRNLVCGLLATVLTKSEITLDWSVVSNIFLYKSLNKSHTGSIRSYLQAMCKITDTNPTLWTDVYTVKNPASKRLTQLLRHGSQNGPPETWTLLSHLIRTVPTEAWCTSTSEVSTIAEAYRSGVLAERVHIDAAWASYVEVAAWLVDLIPEAEGRDRFLADHISPIALSYVTKSADEKWRIGGRAEKAAEAALHAISDQSNVALEKTWDSLVDGTIEKMRLSLPETSKDFKMSQDAVAAQARRLFALQEKTGTGQISKKSRSSLLQAAIALLTSRNGKPYGAAALIDEVARGSETLDSDLKEFLGADWTKLLNSPSSEHLTVLAITSGKPIGATLFDSPKDSPSIVKAIQLFLRQAPASEFDHTPVPSILQRLGDFETEISRAYVVSILLNPNLHEHTVKQQIFSMLITNLGDEQRQLDALSTLRAISADHTASRVLLQSDVIFQVTSKLLVLSDSQNSSIANQANSLSNTLTTSSETSTSSISIIQQQLSGEGDCLSILTLTDLGLKAIPDVDPLDILPSESDWQKAIQPLFNSITQSSLSITSPLRGVVWLVESTQTGSLSITRDREDFSILFRIVFFVTKIFASGNRLKSSSGSKIEALYRWYPVALELINEKLTLDEANAIWLGSTPEVLVAASDVLSEGTELMLIWLENDSYTQEWLLRGSDLEGLTRETYLTALAFQRIVSQLFDVRPQDVLETYSDTLTAIHKSDDILESASLISALGSHIMQSSGGNKMLNELLSEVTQTPGNLQRLVLLNILLADNKSSLEKIPQQRIVFLFKSIISHIQQAEGAETMSESLRLLSLVIPSVVEIYTGQWEDLVKSLNAIWTTSEVSVMHAALQVLAQIRKALGSEQVNEDLVSAMTVNKPQLGHGLLSCLKLLGNGTIDIDQPRAITAELLRRQIKDIEIVDDNAIYDLMNSQQLAVRKTAYDILHRSIPPEQEQLSINLALDQQVSQLPEELLQLVSDADDTQQYLLSWKLIFDHFPTASYRLREIYTSNLKTKNLVGDLLYYLCEKLRITSGRPLDASRIRADEYNLDMSESTEQDSQWLSVNLYYLALTNIPSLVKMWFLDQKNHIKTPLETWTEKYISPLIVSSSISTVSAWSSTQSEDDRPIEVKASARSAEIVASIAVDPESPPISLLITLPGAYPLESPTVVSRSRVGVSEKNWTSWLRTFQIIIFSSGSITEGLVAFRRNVQGALKGQSECAICYSIIGTDMQTPNKKCGTCKNMFHGMCLFRWFKSSNSSSCPLCRNNFNYA